MAFAATSPVGCPTHQLRPVAWRHADTQLRAAPLPALLADFACVPCKASGLTRFTVHDVRQGRPSTPLNRAKQTKRNADHLRPRLKGICGNGDPWPPAYPPAI